MTLPTSHKALYRTSTNTSALLFTNFYLPKKAKPVTAWSSRATDAPATQLPVLPGVNVLPYESICCQDQLPTPSLATGVELNFVGVLTVLPATLQQIILREHS